MQSVGYQSDELKFLYGVLQEAINDAARLVCTVPLHEMVNRLFALADRGERDPTKLKAAILDFATTARPAKNRSSRKKALSHLTGLRGPVFVPKTAIS